MTEKVFSVFWKYMGKLVDLTHPCIPSREGRYKVWLRSASEKMTDIDYEYRIT
jgi:hypothetical protein